MIRAVFDTNVLVSSMIKHGKPRDLWNAVLDGKIHLVVSEEILQELISVSARPKIAKYLDKADMNNFFKILLQKSELVNIEGESLNLAEDPDDNMVLETALVGAAGYIVSGDDHLISIGGFRGIKILTIVRMLKVLDEQRGSSPA